MSSNTNDNLTWYKVLDLDELPEGRVKSVTAGHHQLAMTHYDGQYGALDNRCPHQGGPLGEGSIENGLLRCPWHGWDFCPLDGKPPGGYDDGVPTFPLVQRDDGIYVGLEEEVAHTRTVSDVMVETMVNWGVTHVFGMVGHSNLGLADAFRVQEEKGKLTYIGIRHEGAASFAASAYAKLTGRPAACFSIAGPGATNLLTGLWDAKVDRAPVLALTGQVNTQGLGPGAFRLLVTDTYQRRCAVTGESALPALDAAHIRPVSEGGQHRTDNGLLLRADIRRLFDSGYVTVTPDLIFRVSPRLRDQFAGGEPYHSFDGRDIRPPTRPADRPRPEFLEWHGEVVFRG